MEAKAARGLLATFNAAGVLDLADVHVARRLGTLAREESEPVLLAAALAVRAVRLGSVCVELARMRSVLVEDVDTDALPWPALAETLEALHVSPLVVGTGLRPLRLVDDELLYLERYFLQEQTIRDVLHAREQGAPPYDATRLAAGLAEHFPSPEPDRQRVAAALAVTRWTSIVAGGPGTGKTYTVARVLRLLLEQDPTARIALAAPTGKAAARLQEQVQAQGLGEHASTLHRLLGWRPGSSSRFRHDATNRLPYDVVVVDETSMVSLTLMARLLEALRPDARLVLVGDPDQLASVDAGAVLGDLVHRPVSGSGDPVLAGLVGPDLASFDDRDLALLRGGAVRLSHGWRYDGAISDLALAVRAGEPGPVLDVLRHGDPARVTFVEDGALDAVRADVLSTALTVTKAAEAGDVAGALAALEQHRLLCAHRVGPFGEREWDRRAREWVQEELGTRLDPDAGYAGQPLLVTANDHDAKVYNGDTGVVVAVDGVLKAAFPRQGEPLLLPLSAVGAMRTVYAMTIHRSQGSQYARVTVVLPDQGSALLTRELLYTAVTRAQQHVRVLGTQASIEVGVRQQVLRASGLRRV